MSAPRTGAPLPPGTDESKCAYSHAPGTPPCGKPATLHALSMDPATGDPCTLTACPEHADIARLISGDTHPLTETCIESPLRRWIFGDDYDSTPSHCEAIPS